MKPKLPLLLILVTLLLTPSTRAEDASKWTFDVSLYGLAVGMSGDITVRGLPADLNVCFDEVLDNLELGGMGSVRIGYERWALTTDVIYMGLGASKYGVSADFDQWLVEPTVSYAVCEGFEALAGARYNNLSGEIHGPLGRDPSGTQEWWDPIVGANLSLPLGEKFSFNVRGDIGGFGVGSDFTWQAYPYFGWQFAQWGSLQAGYRWVYMDYESGSGPDQFRYDVLSQGFQLGFTLHF